jgi:hypothetical protein
LAILRPFPFIFSPTTLISFTKLRFWQPFWDAQLMVPKMHYCGVRGRIYLFSLYKFCIAVTWRKASGNEIFAQWQISIARNSSNSGCIILSLTSLINEETCFF